MQRFAGAVIHIMDNLKKINFLTSQISDFNLFLEQNPLEPFSEDVVTYLNALSKKINQNPKTRIYPDVATFAFFCRKANILQLKNKYFDKSLRLGRGLLFHIAPSNVPVNFAFSLVVGILSGNLNIVKVPSKKFDQVEIIADAIKDLGQGSEYSKISDRIVLLRYDRENLATQEISSVCDVRIIWGGDETIKQVRRNELPPRSFDITFADRYSLCVINSDKFVEEGDVDGVANGFYNDTYLFDQNACTSPHLIIWTGNRENIDSAKNIFWGALYKILETRYDVQPVSAIDKLTALYSHSITGSKLNLEEHSDNLIYRVKLDELQENIDNFSCNSGYFYEYDAGSTEEISGIVNRRYQTLSYYGYTKNELSDIIKSIKPVGIDRITPIGKTMDFSLTWDGYNLINILSREVEIT